MYKRHIGSKQWVFNFPALGKATARKEIVTSLQHHGITLDRHSIDKITEVHTREV